MKTTTFIALLLAPTAAATQSISGALRHTEKKEENGRVLVMEPSLYHTMRRASVGRVKELGALYNVQLEDFVAGNVFKNLKTATEYTTTAAIDKGEEPSLVLQRDAAYTDYRYSKSNSVKDAAQVMDLSASLSLSIMCGLVKVDGSGKFARKESSSTKEVAVTMVVIRRTSKREFATNHARSLDKLERPSILAKYGASHFVTEIVFGANLAVTYARKFSSYEEMEELRGSLSAQIKKIAIKVSGKAELELTDEERKSFDNVTISVVGDMTLESSAVDIDGVMKLIREMPDSIPNHGLGVPMQYTLTPLDKLYTESDINFDTTLQQIDEEIAYSLLDYRDELSDAQLELGALCDDLNTLEPVLGRDALEGINQFRNNVTKAMVGLTTKIRKVLRNTDPSAAASILLENLQNSGVSWRKVKEVTRQERAKYAHELYAYQKALFLIQTQELPRLSFAPHGVPLSLLTVGSDVTYLLFMSRDMLDSQPQQMSKEWYEFSRLVEHEEEKKTPAEKVSFKIVTESHANQTAPTIVKFDATVGQVSNLPQAVALEERLIKLETEQVRTHNVHEERLGELESKTTRFGEFSIHGNYCPRASGWVDFGHTFSSVPVVHVSILGLSTMGDSARVSLSVEAVEKSRFRLGIYNTGCEGKVFAVGWIATNAGEETVNTGRWQYVT